MSDGIELIIGSAVYGGWKSAVVQTGLEQSSSRFSLHVASRWSEKVDRRRIYAGDAFSLRIEGETVMQGFVDDAEPFVTDEDYGVNVTGRDTTADLIDCSAIYRSGQWTNAKLDRIARDVASPFNIPVVVDVDVGDPFPSFNIEEGERAFETLDRAARMRGVLLTTDGTGRLILTRASTGAAVANLTQGVHRIKYGSVITSWKERYSKIIVKGQGKGNDSEFGAAVAHGSAFAVDTAITRYRPLVVISEQHGKGVNFQARAEWERNIRRGRGTRGRFIVQGWRNDAGKVWRPNMLVNVQYPALDISENLLVVKPDFFLDERRGKVTELQFAHPSAFEIIAGVKATRLGRRATGANGMEVNKREARHRAKKDKDAVGEIVTFETGTYIGGNHDR